VADGGADEARSQGVEGAQLDIERLRSEIEDLRRSRRRILLDADDERRGLERSLHDGIQQQLVGLAVNLHRVDRLLDDDAVEARAVLGELAAVVHAAIEEAAALASRVYPPAVLEARGLASALRLAADRAGVTADVDVSVGGTPPPALIAAVYWCCAQAIRAAPAGARTRVGVAEEGALLRFEMALDAGYEVGRLVGLRDRVEALGGRLTVEGTGGPGSRLTGELPWA
jgi:signal transduction histidine kinase